MGTNLIAFILSSENRKKIVKTIFQYPNRQWSCSSLEELTKVSHPTVFRTLKGLRYFGILKSTKINKKDIIYELVQNTSLIKELKRIINLEKITAKNIANLFIKKIKGVHSAILYGSSVKGNLKPQSDIDILIIVNKHNKTLENKMFDVAAEVSSQTNKTISVVILDLKEVTKERSSQFIKSIKADMEVLYGKNPL